MLSPMMMRGNRLAPAALATAAFMTAMWLGPAPRAQETTEDADQATTGETGQEAAREAPDAVIRERATSHPEESHSPPTNLKRVGDHWTPYDPPDPESFPEGSTVHIIVVGDTLWDLSGRYLDDPFLWPQIWDVNQYITDSHWIYPGDPLLIPPKPTVIADAGPGDDDIELLEPLPPQPPGVQPTPAAPQPEPMPAAPEMTGPVLSPIADDSEIYCSSYIVDDYRAPDLEIFDREDPSRNIFGEGDIVFLNQGLASDLTPGDEFTVITYEGIVPHPIFDENVGEGVRMVGRLRVIALQEKSATAVITQSCDAIEIGMHLIPFEEIPVPLATPVDFRRYGVEIDTATAGYIVDSSPDRQILATGDIINIDIGADRGLRAGDVLTIFREWGGAIRFDSDDSYIMGQQARAEERRQENIPPEHYPQAILGQMVVLRTRQHTATAKITLADREITLGDRVARR